MLQTLLLATLVLTAQPRWPSPQASLDNGLSISVHPSSGAYIYSMGDTARFEVEVAGSGKLVLDYRFSHGGAAVFDRGRREIKPGKLELACAMSEPGFMRLDLKLHAGRDSVFAAQGVGFDPPLIWPSGYLPDDYYRFWNQGRAELLRIDPDPQGEHRPEFDHDGMRRYLVSLANIDGSRIYGWLTVPAGDGPFPAVVHIPGAPGGVNEFHTQTGEGYASEGILALSLNIHGVPIDLPEETYQQYHRRHLLSYFSSQGAENKYRYYYRRVVLGGLRALDYIYSRPDVDTSRVAVSGGSQGGGLSLLVTSLDKRVRYLDLHVPAMCDQFGALHGRPTGWPHLLEHFHDPGVINTVGYFDGALAAGEITANTVVSVSFLDESCPPTTVYAMFNNLRGPKEILPYPGVHHPGSFTGERAAEMVGKLKAMFGIKN